MVMTDSMVSDVTCSILQVACRWNVTIRARGSDSSVLAFTGCKGLACQLQQLLPSLARWPALQAHRHAGTQTQ
jgi:hypothetical protein